MHPFKPLDSLQGSLAPRQWNQLGSVVRASYGDARAWSPRQPHCTFQARGGGITLMNPNQQLWEKGDFTRIAASMRESGEAVVAGLGVTAGLKVLDLGCG